MLQYKVRRLYNNRPNPRFRHRPWTKIINWGNSHIIQLADGGPQQVINNFEVVHKASNKLSTFRALENIDGIRIPNFTTDLDVARSWVADGTGVLCRTQLHGHSGAGIVLAMSNGQELVAAPLYVAYVKKQKEFRVHVAFKEVIDVQEKRKRRDLPEGFATNFQVRNHQTGWVYCREDIVEPVGLREMAVKTVQALGLDFGAVDIIYNAKQDACYCLEVNTAPGLEGTTIEKYAKAFIKELST